MTEIIDNAILKLNSMGVTPCIINLTEVDYKDLVKEVDLFTKRCEDYADGHIKDIQFYKDIEIDCRVLDEDEAKDQEFRNERYAHRLAVNV